MNIVNQNYVFNGNFLIYRPTDRIKHKFKFRNTNKINEEFIDLLMKTDIWMMDELF